MVVTHARAAPSRWWACLAAAALSGCAVVEPPPAPYGQPGTVVEAPYVLAPPYGYARPPYYYDYGPAYRPGYGPRRPYMPPPPPRLPRPGWGNRDRDGDGIPNRLDPDRDGDGIPNRLDRRPNGRPRR